MDSRRPRYRPPAPPRRRRLPAHVYRRRRVIVGLAAVTVLYVLYLGITLALALFNPSYGISTMARAAEWGRQHSMGPVVTWFEAEYYKLNPPKVGGAPPTSSFGSGATAIRVRTGSHIAPPARIPSPAGTPLPIVQRLSTEIQRCMQKPEVQEKFLNAGVESVGTTSERFSAIVKGEMAKWGKLIKETGIRAD